MIRMAAVSALFALLVGATPALAQPAVSPAGPVRHWRVPLAFDGDLADAASRARGTDAAVTRRWLTRPLLPMFRGSGSASPRRSVAQTEDTSRPASWWQRNWKRVLPVIVAGGAAGILIATHGGGSSSGSSPSPGGG